ncbi:MAG: hypothetical protein QOI42_698, partial [Frankiaceae bacterium]|nr:hypothetical protein [Frankiaceae bacterium]
MSCSPAQPCGVAAPVLAVRPPPPGLAYLTRRLGRYDDFFAELIARIESRPVPGASPSAPLLGDRWDVLADPPARLLAELWALVADSVSTYSELTANEAYLDTARDWTDLRRIAALVGYAPRPRVAATGWLEVDIDPGTNPTMPAGTRAQAPALPPERPKSQQFEAIEDTVLVADWADLTATWVPQSADPTGRSVRFLGDPGFGAGDRVLFVLEEPPVAPLLSGYDWFGFWTWMVSLFTLAQPPTSTPLAVAKVRKRSRELGTTIVDFDRDLDTILAGKDQPYAAYRITATAGSARHLTKVLSVSGTTASTIDVSSGTFYTTPSSISSTPTSASVVLDAALDDLSSGQLVAIVDWNAAGGSACDIVRVDAHSIVRWEAAPGSPTRVSQLSFASAVGTLAAASGDVTVHVLDHREMARHYEFPDASPDPSHAQLRLYPAPTKAPERIAVDVSAVPNTPDWRLVEVSASAAQEQPGSGPDPAPVGLTVDVQGVAPPLVGRGKASANLVAVRHGATTSATLGSGDAFRNGQRFTIPDSPVAYDVDPAGNIVPSLVLRVDGLTWAEVPTLYGTGAADDFDVQLGADGSVTAVFGDGAQGRRLPTGRNNVTATYRVGGGTEGEVPSGAINALVGSVRGVKRVRGAGPTSGGADQDAEHDLARLAPARARAFGRVVSQGDVADLALAFPGVTHATAWHGAGPPGCACGGVGLHVAVLRRGSDGKPRPALAAELDALAAYLDGRRDTLVPLCVSAGLAPSLALSATLVVDPRRAATTVATAAAALLSDPDGSLAP